MYKIMIADDEGIVIDALRFIIRENFGDSCVIEAAKTGKSAIELAENFHPDIALMDIHMPGINGIEAMKEIQKSNRNIIFIVMSAYDKFDYARETLRLGAMEYVYKPIDKKEIAELLKKAMNRTDADRKKRSDDLMIREKLETVIPIIESGFIYSLLLQENYAQETKNFKNLLGITEEFGYMMVVEYGDKKENGHMTNAIGSSVKMSVHYALLRDDIKEFFRGVVGPVMANNVLVLVPCKDNLPDREYEERVKIIDRARRMIRKLKQDIDAQFRVGIGSVYPLEEGRLSYMEAVNSFRCATGSVSHAKDLLGECGYEDYPLESERGLFEGVQEGDVSASLTCANHFLDYFAGEYPKNAMDVKLKALEAVLYAERIARESGEAARASSGRDYLSKMTELESLGELRQWFLERVKEAAENVSESRKKNRISLIEKAKKYIKEYCLKEISLDEVSKEVNLSPYYFSKLFKEETGENFIEFVTEIRMEKAKGLLRNTEKSMKEISLEVGYQDPNYFSRSFKKNVGVAPREYREGKVQDDAEKIFL